MSNATRFCIIEPISTAPIVSLTASKEFVAGADFKIVNAETKEVIETWKMTAEEGKSSVYKIRSEIGKLNKLKMVWQVLCCSKNANVYEGKVHIQITQNKVPCKLTIPASYAITNVPPCSLNSAEDFKGTLFFVVKSRGQEII